MTNCDDESRMSEQRRVYFNCCAIEKLLRYVHNIIHLNWIGHDQGLGISYHCQFLMH